MVDRGLFSKNQPAKYEPGHKVIGTVFPDNLLKHQGTELVGKDKHTEVFAMLQCQFEDVVEFLAIEFLEEHGDDETVDKPDFTAVLKPVPESLEDGEDFFVSDHEF